MAKRLIQFRVSSDSSRSYLTFSYNSWLATISKEDLTECLHAQFPMKTPSAHLINALFRRFRPLKVDIGCEGIEQADEMDIVDFLLGCNLLSRVTQDKKIKRKYCNPLLSPL